MMHKAVPVSCYIRTYNEEKRIGETLKAARNVSDDILLIDSGSTDKTIEIAEALGARIVQQSWLGNGYQKRIGEDNCKYDWVIDIDADEVISPELANSIVDAIKNSTDLDSGYLLKIAYVPPGGKPWSNFAVAKRAKLYRKSKHRIPAHKAWDQMPDSETRSFPTLNGHLLHYSWTSLEQLHGKLNRVSSTRASESRTKNFPNLYLRIIFGFYFYFFKSYVLRGLFWAGLYGFIIAVSFAFARWQRDAKIYESMRQGRLKGGKDTHLGNKY